jgi:3-oxoacyl-(acyl-carrier-protein) synthase
MTAPAPTGTSVVAAVRDAVGQAGLEPTDIAYINAHGTATRANDDAEVSALRTVFDQGLPPLSASKSFLGHTLGAAGAIESVVTVLAVRDGLLPATLHSQGADFDTVPSPREADVPYALSTAFAFGGNNVALVFAR